MLLFIFSENQHYLLQHSQCSADYIYKIDIDRIVFVYVWRQA